MDVALPQHPDHEFNASTFAARVAVATLADLHAAVVAAIATLKGPRHGGANEDVLRMLQEIGDPAKAEAFVERRLGARGALSKAERANPKARVPGFGHRVYRVDDARARVLRGMAKTMAEATGRERLFEVAERLYDAMKARTDLPVNVDFFSAVVYDALGIPADLCTSIFAGVRALRIERAVLLVQRIEVRAGAREVGGIALADGVHVDGVRSRRQTLGLHQDAHDAAGLREARGADGLAGRVLDVGHGGVVTRLHAQAGASGQRQRDEDEAGASHALPPSRVKSCLARASASGEARRSSAVSARALAPASMPARASGERAHSANSREWPGTPSGEMRM